jgi:hypothetical protein
LRLPALAAVLHRGKFVADTVAQYTHGFHSNSSRINRRSLRAHRLPQLLKETLAAMERGNIIGVLGGAPDLVILWVKTFLKFELD